MFPTDEVDTNLHPPDPTSPPMTPKTRKRVSNAFNFPSGEFYKIAWQITLRPRRKISNLTSQPLS